MGKKSLNLNTNKMEFCNFPDEILCLIFCFTGDQDWLAFSANPPYLVCKRWHSILTSFSFWQTFHHFWKRSGGVKFASHLPWQYLASIRVSHKYQQNLLKNASGELTSETELALQETRALDEDFLMSPWPEYPFWKIWSSAGEGWKVKMCKDPEKFTIYFFTSYHSCTKEQLIDLEDHFPNDRLLFRSDMQTNLSVEQWYKFTGPCTLDLSIDLLDKHRGKLDRIEKFIVYKHPGEAQEVWKNLSFTLTRSFKDVRYLKFYHGGTCDEVIEDEETQKIVGTCLAQASVSLSLPELVLK